MAHVRTSYHNLTWDDASSAQTFNVNTADCTYARIGFFWERAQGHTALDSAPTIDGDAMTSLGAVVAHATVTISGQAYEIHTPTQGTVTVSVDPNNGSGNAQMVAVFQGFDDVDSGTPSDGYVTNTGTTSPGSATITSESGDVVSYMLFVKTAFAPGSLTPTNYTEGAADHTVGVYMATGGFAAGDTSIAASTAISAGAVAGWIAIGGNLNAAAGGGAASAAVTGTAGNGATEAQIVAGGETIIITLTDDTWVASGATFDAIRQDIIDGLDSGGSEANAWNAEVRDAIAVTTVARTSDTIVTITLPALASYAVSSAGETVTVTVPASAVTGAAQIVATPTFDITNSPSATSTTWEHGEFGPADTTYVLTFNDVGFSGTSAPAEIAPNDLSVVDNGDGTATLSWTDSVTDNTGYAVERKTGNGSFAEIEDDAGDVETFDDTGPLDEDTIYTYRVKVLGGDLAGSYSNEDSIGGGGATTPGLVDESHEQVRWFAWAR